MPPPNVKPSARLLLLVPLLLCAACATRSPASMRAPIPMQQEMPALPPALAKPPPPGSYSAKAQERMQTWQQRLTASETK